ncbi:MAG TPA: hypothetical protein VNY84_11785, partial [Acidimicrobiales bacterium]|nr:hypothetical protein [Acidimicrobiales bacterium]
AFLDFALTFIGTTNQVDNSLYLMSDGLPNSTLGLFNVATGSVSNIGAGPLPATHGDMTSNGDGSLYFLMDQSTPTLFDLDPTNGAVKSSANLATSGGGTQALAFWGGSFYAFENNVINRYDPKMATTTMLGMAPLDVTGAGQSTCVPKVPPPPPH